MAPGSKGALLNIHYYYYYCPQIHPFYHNEAMWHDTFYSVDIPRPSQP